MADNTGSCTIRASVYERTKSTSTRGGSVSKPHPGKPVPCSGRPAHTPAKPQPCSGKPSLTPGKPAPCSGTPVPCSGKPAPCSGKPDPTPGKPAPCSGKPTHTPAKPQPCSGKPGLTPGKPAPCSEKPIPYSGKPAAPCSGKTAPPRKNSGRNMAGAKVLNSGPGRGLCVPAQYRCRITRSRRAPVRYGVDDHIATARGGRVRTGVKKATTSKKNAKAKKAVEKAEKADK